MQRLYEGHHQVGVGRQVPANNGTGANKQAAAAQRRGVATCAHMPGPPMGTNINKRGLYRAIDLAEKMDVAEVLQLLKERRNVLLCAPAGHGKTTAVVEVIAPFLKELCGEDPMSDAPGAVWITSTTGISALAVGGDTIHALSGAGRFDGTAEDIAKRIRASPAMLRRWQELDVLLLEECSMMSAESFMKLEKVSRLVRDSEEFFGGVQLVFIGDFCQLPPINNVTERRPAATHVTSAAMPTRRRRGGVGGGREYEAVPVRYAFEAENWDKASWEYLTLAKCWRQDQAGVEDNLHHFLSVVRTCVVGPQQLGSNPSGGCTTHEHVPDEVMAWLERARTNVDSEFEAAATRLFAHKTSVRSVNKEYKNRLEPQNGEDMRDFEQRYRALDR